MILHTHVQKHHQGQDQHTSSPQNSHPNPTQLDRGEGSSRKGATTSNRNKADQSGKLTFVARSEKREKFDLSDLLKAAAEILGSGCFGSSYKATLLNGVSVVVKRFKQMNHVGKEEFNEHMRRIGRLDHPNLLPLVAYYYRKEEKLFVTDVVPRGSLAVLLHGRSRGQAALDWVTRLNIIKGVARGLSYLYKELPCLIAPHGHLKSSNVLIDHSFNPLLHDYALIPLINPESAQKLMVAYKSPEFIQTHRISKKTDVWALGILILETLTGKFPASFLHQGSEVDLKSWVDEVVKEGFDEEMEVSEDCEGEMEKMMKIGLECCESDMEKRLDLKEACKRIEHVRERRDDDHGDDDNEKSGDFSVIIN